MTAAERKRKQRARLGITSGNADACSGGQRMLVPVIRECACGCGETFVVGGGVTKRGEGSRLYVSEKHRDAAAKVRKETRGAEWTPP